MKPIMNGLPLLFACFVFSPALHPTASGARSGPHGWPSRPVLQYVLSVRWLWRHRHGLLVSPRPLLQQVLSVRRLWRHRHGLLVSPAGIVSAGAASPLAIAFAVALGYGVVRGVGPFVSPARAFWVRGAASLAPSARLRRGGLKRQVTGAFSPAASRLFWALRASGLGPNQAPYHLS